MIEFVDSHSHVDVAEFDEDRDAVVVRARDAGVHRQVVPAIQASTWPGLKQVCHTHEGLLPAYGLHPVFLPAHRETDIGELHRWIERERPLAIGECGLDFFVPGLDIEKQAQLFNAQLRLAREFDLPVIVHARRAVDAVIEAVRRIGGLRGVVHSFSGSVQQAEILWREGFLLGLGGPVTYPRAVRLRKLAATMPIEFMLLETDSPDQPDSALRGKRNEPARVVHVAQVIAELRGQPLPDVARATTANATRLFALPA